MFGYFEVDLPGFGIFHYCSQRNFNINIFSISARTSLFSSWFTNAGFNMSFVFQVKNGPHFVVSNYNYVASASTVLPRPVLITTMPSLAPSRISLFTSPSVSGVSGRCMLM